MFGKKFRKLDNGIIAEVISHEYYVSDIVDDVVTVEFRHVDGSFYYTASVFVETIENWLKYGIYECIN